MKFDVNGESLGPAFTDLDFIRVNYVPLLDLGFNSSCKLHLKGKLQISCQYSHGMLDIKFHKEGYACVGSAINNSEFRYSQ